MPCLAGTCTAHAILQLAGLFMNVIDRKLDCTYGVRQGSNGRYHSSTSCRQSTLCLLACLNSCNTVRYIMAHHGIQYTMHTGDWNPRCEIQRTYPILFHSPRPVCCQVLDSPHCTFALTRAAHGHRHKVEISRHPVTHPHPRPQQTLPEQEVQRPVVAAHVPPERHKRNPG